MWAPFVLRTFPPLAGETLPRGLPVTLTLALSHQGRGDVPAPPPRAYPARIAPLARVPLRFAKGACCVPPCGSPPPSPLLKEGGIYGLNAFKGQFFGEVAAH